jgi:aminoglycoside phosphotransferase (APT) family kinase protein
MNKNLIMKIHKIFPNLKWKKTKFITSGWDYDIFLLDKNFVVRIPKNNEAKKRMPIDFCLLTYLNGKIDADIPIPILKDTKSKIAIYKAVDGTTMSEARYKKLKPYQKNKFAKIVSSFLSQLHKIPKDAVRKCRAPEKDAIAENREVASNSKFICSNVSRREKSTLDVFMKKRKKILKRFSSTLIHGDLTSENIFIKKNFDDNLGIIDFSDAVIDDPARDFAALFSYGDQFVRTVIRYYQGSSKQKIFERAKIYYQEMAITLLAWSIKGSKLIKMRDAKKIFHQRLNIKRV